MPATAVEKSVLVIEELPGVMEQYAKLPHIWSVFDREQEWPWSFLTEFEDSKEISNYLKKR